MQSQLAGGNFKDKPYGTSPAVAGLAVVAMLAHGDDPVHGPYSGPIKRGLNFIVSRQNKTTGYIGTTMYNHGFATLALAEAYAAVYAVVGWHPNDLAPAPDDVRPALRELCSHPKVVAIGETGIDHFRLPSGNGGSEADD